jgi:hypothetical protein
MSFPVTVIFFGAGVCCGRAGAKKTANARTQTRNRTVRMAVPLPAAAFPILLESGGILRFPGLHWKSSCKILFAILLTRLPTWVNLLKLMPADPINPAAAAARQSLIAPLWHTLSVLLIFGYFSFRDAQHAQNAASVVAPHGAIIRAYLLMIFYEWGMAAWAWGGAQF